MGGERIFLRFRVAEARPTTVTPQHLSPDAGNHDEISDMVGRFGFQLDGDLDGVLRSEKIQHLLQVRLRWGMKKSYFIRIPTLRSAEPARNGIN